MSQENINTLLELAKAFLAGSFTLILFGLWLWFLDRALRD